MPASARSRARLLSGAVLAVLLVLLTGRAEGDAAGPPPRPPRPEPSRDPGCTAPVPRTAGGYSHLFAAIPTRQWGAADLAITVPVAGRSVWLFGDTLSGGPDGRGRFVHSSAIVQRGGCLHVSRDGAQLLPDDRVERVPTRAHPSRIYWIVSGRARSATALEITARSILLFGRGPWDFRDGGVSRTALVDLDRTGDLTFRRWVDTRRTPPPDPGPLIDCEAPQAPRPHHFCYARHVHPELALAGRRVLVTVAQNWDDGTLHRYEDYRPLFRSAAKPTDRRPGHLAGWGR